MKHYLDLISISAKHHKAQTRMTRFCIVLAVFLVTVIFGMADMEMRSQLVQAVRTDGSWHAGFLVNEEQEALIGARPEVKQTARYESLNYRLKDHYQIEGEETVICGFDREFLDMYPDVDIVEGTFPQSEDEAVVNENIINRLELEIGEMISLKTPQGAQIDLRITGITKNTALMAEHDAFGIFLSMDGFFALNPESTEADQEAVCFVIFRPYCNIQKAIGEISSQLGLGEEQVRQNAKVLMLLFQSRDTYLMRFYFVAGVLAVLVVAAGVFMIAASMNSNNARRTEFFGMMRCLGAVRKQIVRFVRREALSWCKTAVPAGLLAGTVVVWLLCKMLRFLSPGLFEGLPVFGISYIGLAAGTVVGVITVLLAARSPAKQAAGVSPLAAVSGNARTVQAAKRAADTRFFKVDAALGIHHAMGSRRNFFLVTGSFAFSIILFLSFSTAVDFMHHAITPLRPSAPDIYAYSEDTSNKIPSRLVDELKNYPGVKRVFGRSYGELSAFAGEKEITLTVLSYDEQQFSWAEKSLIEGSLSEVISGKGLLLVYRSGSLLKMGSSVTLLPQTGRQQVSVSGVLSDVPYNYGTSKNTGIEEEMVICSEEMFEKLTGEQDYAVLDMQLQPDAGDAQVQQLRRAVEQACGREISFSDKRIGNREAKGAGYSMAVFLYGFLVVIAMIGFFNIMNCIAMSVSARMREYGAMRAVGMEVRQLARMIWGETLTYTVCGTVFGCAVGLPLNRAFFRSLVTSRWGDAWTLPGWEFLVIVAVMSVSVCLAAAGPVRRIRQMTVVETIGR